MQAAGSATSMQAAASTDCSICLETIKAVASPSPLEAKRLDCSHIFHKECIGEWVKRIPNCPLCRADVKPDNTAVVPVPAPVVAPSPVAEHAPVVAHDRNYGEVLAVVRGEIGRIRQFRVLDLNEQTPVAQTARKVNAVAARIFGFKNN